MPVTCHSLQKLSFAFLSLNSSMIIKMALQNGNTLQVLDFCDCEGLDFESIQHIIDYCTELKEVCFANWDEHYTEDCIDYLANNLTTKVHITLFILKIYCIKSCLFI